MEVPPFCDDSSSEADSDSEVYVPSDKSDEGAFDSFFFSSSYDIFVNFR